MAESAVRRHYPSPEDGRRQQRAARTGRPGRTSHARQIAVMSKASAWQPGNEMFSVCGTPPIGVHSRARDAGLQLLQERRRKRCTRACRSAILRLGQIESRCQADHQGDGLGAGPMATVAGARPRAAVSSRAASAATAPTCPWVLELGRSGSEPSTPRPWNETGSRPTAWAASQ